MLLPEVNPVPLCVLPATPLRMAVVLEVSLSKEPGTFEEPVLEEPK